MGSLRGQHPHFQLNQLRMRAQSQTLRGSAASAWGAGGMVGAAPLPLTQSPGQMRRQGSAQRLSPPEALLWELGTGVHVQGSRFLCVDSPASPAPLPADSLRVSESACGDASCPFYRASGLWCGGAGIQSAGAERGEPCLPVSA